MPLIHQLGAVDLMELTEEDIAQVASLYVEIFTAEPWLEEWTIESAIQAIQNARSRHLYTGYVACRGADLVGITWGYVALGEELIKEISETCNFIHLPKLDETLAYINEVAVHPNYRGNGLGKLMTKKLMGQFELMGYSQIALQTNFRANVAVSMYHSLGFRFLEIRSKEDPQQGYWLFEIK